LRIALISPLDQWTGVSKYSYHLFKALRNCGADVSLYYQARKVHPAVKNDTHLKNFDQGNFCQELMSFDIVHFQISNSEFHHFENHLLPKIKAVQAKKVATLHEEVTGMFNLKCFDCWKAIGFDKILETLTTQASIFSGFRDRLRDVAELWIRNVDGLVFHSHYLLRSMHRLTFKKRTRVIYHIGYFENEDATNRTNNKSIIFVPGYVAPTKTIVHLLDGLSSIKRNYNFKLLINSPLPGNERHMMDLKRKIERTGLSKNIIMVGFQSEQDFVETFFRASIVVIPRRVTFGEVSGAMVHALCAGRPVVAPKAGSYPEYVEGHGLLCDMNTLSAWEKAVRYLIENEDQRKRLGEKAKKFALEKLWPHRIAKEHLEFYELILHK